MKHVINILILLTVLFSSSCNRGNGSGETRATRTTMALSEEMHDFGKIKRGEVIQYTFKAKNTGKAELIIANVEASCGCTGVKFSSKPVAPGESADIQFTFNSDGFTGNVFKTIKVYSNAKPDVVEFKFGALVEAPDVH
jgi:hypothetical protein